MTPTATLDKTDTQKSSTNKRPTRRKAKKTATISMRVEPTLKQNAEEVCNRIGLSTTDAIEMFLYQIVRTQGIPVDISNLAPCPDSFNADVMSAEEILNDIKKGLKDIEEGKTVPFSEVLNDIKGLY